MFGRKPRSEPGQTPWMDPIEFSQLVAVLAAAAPRRILEWGSGGSTRSILSRFPAIETYVSVEHDREWYEMVRDMNDDPRLELHHVPADEPRPAESDRAAVLAWDQRANEDPTLMQTYVAFPKTKYDSYDFVLVDGRARVFCLQAGWDLLPSGGVMIIHDAQRVVYHETIRRLGDPVFLEPWKQGQICILRKP